MVMSRDTRHYPRVRFDRHRRGAFIWRELSNDPLGENDPELTMEINHRGSVQFARKCKEAGVGRFVYVVIVHAIRRAAGAEIKSRNLVVRAADGLPRLMQGTGRTRSPRDDRRPILTGVSCAIRRPSGASPRQRFREYRGLLNDFVRPSHSRHARSG